MILAIFVLAAIIAPPIFSAKGIFYRGIWFAFMFVCAVLSVLFFLTIGQIAYQENIQHNPASASILAADVTWFFFAAAFGCLLAGCTFRKKVTTGGTTAPKRA
jgi:O-antigen/teichoic acid export membrane protein